MITTLPNPVANEVSDVSFAAVLLEPLMVIGSVLFWALVLPLAGALRLSVGTYDAFASIVVKTRKFEGLLNRQANPLVLRRGASQSEKAVLPSEVARQGV